MIRHRDDALLGFKDAVVVQSEIRGQVLSQGGFILAIRQYLRGKKGVLHQGIRWAERQYIEERHAAALGRAQVEQGHRLRVEDGLRGLDLPAAEMCFR